MITIPSPFTGSLCETRTHIPIVHQKAVKAKGRGLARISKAHSKRLREYSKLRAKFLAENPYCKWHQLENGYKDSDINPTIGGPNYPASADFLDKDGWPRHLSVPASAEVHHVRGRGKYLLDTSTWMAVSSWGHKMIHEKTAHSYKMGYMKPRR